MAPRKKTEKSRRGCRQCKIRRIKCDEREPQCNNCLRKGLSCPGQARQIRWSTKHELIGSQASASATSSATAGVEHQTGLSQLPVEEPTTNASKVESWSDRTDAVVRMSDTDDAPAVAPSWDDTSWLDDLNDVFLFEPGVQNTSTMPVANSVMCSPSTKTPAVCVREPVSALSLGSPSVHIPIELSTTLVEYWFSHVCPMWSAFDSAINHNRKIPLDTWTTSEPVFYALQAMSAAVLADSMPQMNSIVPSLINQATTTIQQRMSALRRAPNIPAVNITIDLLFAVFAMGTSMHWTDASQFGDKLLQDAREVLGLWQLNLTNTDAMVHAYFHQALTWWEMMSCLADRELKCEKLDRKRLRYEMRLRQAINLEDSQAYPDPPLPLNDSVVVEASRLHPFCGASSEVIDLFGQCVALCRSSRSRHRQRTKHSLRSTTDALAEIALARDLQNELLQMDFDVMVAVEELQGISLHTGDEKTPVSHLVLTAEAYRHASLMQLFLTFEDLEIIQPTQQDTITTPDNLSSTETVPRHQILVAMALQLVKILEQIPVDSRSSCIQPPLLLLAAAGLRMDKAIQPEREYSPNGVHTSTTSNETQSGRILPPPNVGFSITKKTIEVANARRLVRTRLSALHGTLPPKPIQVAVDLVKAIWREYDGLTTESESHWLDVMNDTGLKTIFG